MNKEILIVHTAWYQEYISKMLAISQETLEDFNCTNAVAPGALELAALAAQKLQDSSFIGVLFLGIERFIIHRCALFRNSYKRRNISL